MALKINTNTSSLIGQNNLNRTDKDVETPLKRLSSGKRINSAKDDAAGLAIVAKMTTQILGTSAAIRNTNDGISLAQVAEGGLQEAGDILQRVRELAVQSVNATNSASDRRALQDEVGQLTAELNRITGSTQFNGQNLLDGSFDAAQFQVGANAGDTIVAGSGNFSTDYFGGNHLLGTNTSVAAGDRITANGTLSIDSNSGSATVNYSAGDSAATIAENINQYSEQTGVTATASTETTLSFGGAGNYQLDISSGGNTETVSFNLSNSNGADSLGAAVQAINDRSNNTGVTARLSDDGNSINLTQQEGESVTIRDTGTANAADVTVSANGSSVTLTADATIDTAVATGQVTLDSDRYFTASGSAGDVIDNPVEVSSLEAVSQVDVSSVEQANNSLAVVDSAIANVATQRASFGALQNKFESTIRNSENYQINTAASRSRIEDADFAKETADLTRSLILKQTGAAVLGQANALPQLVLGLLDKRR